MKSLHYLIPILLFALFVVACERGDNLYEDPEVPAEVTPSTMLTALEVNTFQNVEGDFARISAMYAGQIAGATSQYQAFQNYDITEGDFNNLWVQLYPGTMKNAKLLVNLYGAENPYYAGIAKVILALNLGISTDLWGDVPYSSAFQAEEGNFRASIDPQAQVLDTIQKLLDEAIAHLSEPASDNILLPGSDDIIYGGDATTWIRAAWTLKARYANRLSLKDPQGSANMVLDYLENGMSSPVDIMEAKHSPESLNQWGAFQNQREGNIVSNKFFVDQLLENDDPRLKYYFETTDAGEYEGADVTMETINTAASVIGSYLAVDRNFPILTYFEAKFLEAEALSRLGQDASQALNEAIMASVSYVTQGTDDGQSLATYTAGTASLENIMTEKWKAMFGQIEPYNDYRRTGIPDVPVRPGSAGAIRGYIPKRFPTPQQEREANPNAVIYELDVPVWWAEEN